MSFALGIPRSFKYVKVKDLGEALEALSEGSKVLAGGQSLLPLLKLRIMGIDTLVDINNLEFRGVRENEKEIEIYSLTTHNEVASKVKILSKVAFTIADLQVRNKGTIGGSLAHADPSANYYPALLVLNARVKVISKRGEREINVKDLYLSPYTTSLNYNEIIKSVVIPKQTTSFAFEVYKRGGASYPSSIVAVAISNGKYKVGFGGISEKPVLIEGEIEGEKSKREVIDKLKEIKMLSDIHADSETRRKITEKLFERAFERAMKGQIDEIQIPNNEISWNSTPIKALNEKVKVRVKVNDLYIEDEVEPRTLLLDFLRRNGYKEVKRGCDEGKCGACTVVINGRAVKSCLTLAVQVVDQDIRTVKGIHDIQPLKDSFVNNYAMQCGYCTHGFLMATYDYLKHYNKPDNEILSYSIKNICRCTGYFNIIKAIKSASLNQ